MAMMSYVVFCSLFLVEVMGICKVHEFSKQITDFIQSGEIESCMSGEYAHLHLPISWIYQTDCLWACIDEGFDVIRNKFPQPSSSCAEDILNLGSTEEEINIQCKDELCTGTCKNSTGGDVREFLRDVLEILEKIEPMASKKEILAPGKSES